MAVEVRLPEDADFDAFRRAARPSLAYAMAPGNVVFRVGPASGDLFATGGATESDTTAGPIAVPGDYVRLALMAALHRSPRRFDLLYKLLWRLREDRSLLKDRADPDVAACRDLAKAVRRDVHKMRAFIRFREIKRSSGRQFVAWFEPDHHIVEHNAPFFVGRFTGMRWTIITPQKSVDWDGHSLSFAEGAARDPNRAEDGLEELWQTYYRSVFNPARRKPAAMRAEMPKKYWRNLPEARLIPELEHGKVPDRRTGHTVGREAAADLNRAHAERYADKPSTMADLREAVDSCRRCPLWQCASRAVHGRGPASPSIVLVGEQPGDAEDMAGVPFVGPAGQLLDEALERAGIDGSSVYRTNAVRHFKHEMRGKRRIHKTPSTREIEHCRLWLDAELAILKPRTIVALGRTALKSLTGASAVPPPERRYRAPDATGQPGLLITRHPAWVLRSQGEARDAAFRELVADLARVA